MARRRRIDADRGGTLLELIVAIAILGVCVVAIASGITVSILVSNMHRKESTAGAYVRSYAEAIQNVVSNSGYVKCATSATPTYSMPAGFTLPSNVDYEARVTGVDYITATGGWTSSCTLATDLGTERVNLQVRSTDDSAIETLSVVVRNCVTSCS
jgi:prepilin-type N-terminal cleavage/methylation domain-containing protein